MPLITHCLEWAITLQIAQLIHNVILIINITYNSTKNTKNDASYHKKLIFDCQLSFSAQGAEVPIDPFRSNSKYI